jgi:succinate dehydrogenase / fumarate reductase, cytochrome b subunit
MRQSDPEKRPLSPHLQIYRIQITSLLSILHRATGIILYVGGLLLAAWFIVLGTGSENYETLQRLYLHPIGLVMLMGFSFSFFYHLCNGVRHLFWDAGVGYEMKTVRITGWMVVISSFFLTGVSWVLGYLCQELWV